MEIWDGNPSGKCINLFIRGGGGQIYEMHFIKASSSSEKDKSGVQDSAAMMGTCDPPLSARSMTLPEQLTSQVSCYWNKLWQDGTGL